jgi:hypothetical protein
MNDIGLADSSSQIPYSCHAVAYGAFAEALGNQMPDIGFHMAWLQIRDCFQMKLLGNSNYSARNYFCSLKEKA